MRRIGVVLGALVIAMAALPAARAGFSSGLSAGTGCDPAHPAVAHHPGGVVLTPQPARAPVPCSTSTGYAAAESHIVVANDGAVVFTPAVVPAGALGTGEGPAVDPDTQGNASPGAMAISTDRSRTWSLVSPAGATWNPTDHAEFVDPATGRLFFEDYGPVPLAPQLGPDQEGPAHIMWSADDGASWHHTTIDGLVLPENPRFTAAPAPAGQPHPSGYADVVYFCANTNVGFTSPAIVGRLCYKSLDGGSTWAETSMVFNGAVPEHPQCGTSGEQFSAVDGYYPAPAPDGSLYLLVACGGSTYLARSTDEAASFPIVRPVSLALPTDSVTSIGSGPQLRTDPAGNLYLLYPKLTGSAVSGLLLSVSRDQGATWTAPIDLTAPGVKAILRWAVAESGIGHLAVAYVGQRAGQTTWDAYLTETRDALDAFTPGQPVVLWSAPTNRVPLMYADHITGAGYIEGAGQIAVPYPFPLGIQPVALGQLSAGNDFMGAAIGPDGTPWGSFNQDCGPAPDSAGCQATKDQTRGLAAHFQWPAAP